jgi:putative tricarboxylic transport membrane protein
MSLHVSAGRRFAAGDMAVALGALGLGLVVLWQAGEIPVSPIYAKVGPTAAPYLCAFGLIVMGAALVWEALRGGWQPDEEREAAQDWRAIGWVAAGLALNVVTIGPLGFTLASILLFTCVARGFGSTNMLRDAAIGAAFALIAYLGFAKALNINIGAGIVENAIEAALRGFGRR